MTQCQITMDPSGGGWDGEIGQCIKESPENGEEKRQLIC